MHKRNVRLRKEYIYRKSLEGKEREEYEKKRKIKQSLNEGTVIPTELKAESRNIHHAVKLDDANTEREKSHLDDEYALAGIHDPKILITSSRSPSSRLQQCVKEFRYIFPNSTLINRGGAQLKELVESARRNEFTDIVMVHEHRGQPDGLIISHLPYGPTAYFGMYNVVLRHDIEDNLPPMSEAYPHLIFHKFETRLGQRVQTILKYLFPVPKPDSHRVMTFANRSDIISVRHHTYKKDKTSIKLTELGPRFELKLYQVKLGTPDMDEAQTEWVLRPYMNTAAKRTAL